MTDHDDTHPHAAPDAAPATETRPEAETRSEASAQPARRMPPRRTIVAAAAALGIFAVGAGAGATAWSMGRDGRGVAYDAAMTATPTAQLTDSSAIGIRGKVVEIFGNKFVMEDAAGRALVETGRSGRDGGLVAAGEDVTVQGRFDDGFLHATAIRHADERIDELSPPPRRHGPGGRGPGHGPRD